MTIRDRLLERVDNIASGNTDQIGLAADILEIVGNELDVTYLSRHHTNAIYAAAQILREQVKEINEEYYKLIQKRCKKDSIDHRKWLEGSWDNDTS